jgi:hypothetical protein
MGSQRKKKIAQNVEGCVFQDASGQFKGSWGQESDGFLVGGKGSKWVLKNDEIM